MTALTQQEVQPLPHLLKAVLLMFCATVALMAFLLIQPRHRFAEGVVLAASATGQTDGGVIEGKVSPFGPLVRVRK